MTLGHLWALPILAVGLFYFPSHVLGSSPLEISADSNFSTKTTEFNAGQTIYVRISADNDGKDKHQLNLRDNQYKFLQSYSLNRINDNQFSTSFSAPASEGYYSLEAQIESEDSKTTSVQTIKVGNPTNANVRVNVKNEVAGQSVRVNENTAQSPSPTTQTEESQNSEQSPNSESESLSNPDFSFGQTSATAPADRSFFSDVGRFFKTLWQVIWPF